MLSGETGKRYSNVGDLILFWATGKVGYVDHFCLKMFSLFSTEGLRGRGQLHVQERHCPDNKIAYCFIKHNGKEQDQEATLRYLILLWQLQNQINDKVSSTSN